MKILSTVYLLLIGICSFLHYPLAVIYPYGVKTSVNMVFNYEFPHVFLASFLSLFYIGLKLDSLNIKDRTTKVIFGALGLILLSGIIFGVPFYRVLETAAYFTVPIGVFLAVKDTAFKELIIYILALVFLVNLCFCLFLPGNVKIGICGNQNWLAATLIGSLPFFILCLRKLPKKVFLSLGAIIVIASVVVFIRTSARALVPAVGLFVLFYIFQRKSWKVNAAIAGGLVLLFLVFVGVKSETLKRGLNQDIRGPLTLSTLDLILSTPFLGTGPGNFQRDFPPHASETLKKRIYYSSIVEHPHNEFLYMAASTGFPSAVLWLIFLCFLLKRRDDFEGLAVQFSAVTLFIMGMADKPLQESPSAIIFLIACGMLVPKSVLRSEAGDKKSVKVFGVALAVSCLAFGVYRTQLDIQSRYHFWKGDSLRVRMNSFNQKEIVPDMLEHYVKSSDIDPTFINAAYNAASTSLHFYNDLARDERLLQRMISLEPDYSDFNVKIADYYMKQARLLGEGKEKREIEAEAEKYYLRNYELSPWNINRCRSVVRFYSETDNGAKVEAWIIKARQIAWERMKTWYTHTDRIDLKGDMSHWIEEVAAGKKEPFSLNGVMKANEGLDYSRFNMFQRTNTLQSYPLRNTGDLDRKFFARRLKLLNLQFSKGLSSTESILNFMASFDVNDGSIDWPLNVFEKGAGNARSLASLACALNSGIGNESALLVNPEGQILCVLFEGKKCWIWNCKESVLVQTPLEEFHTNKDLRLQLCGQVEDNFVYELLCYPEAFCLRNQVASDVIISFTKTLFPCISPELSMVRLKRKIGERAVRFANKHIGLLDAEAMKKN
ncbi:MAG: O-antigen ligase family protein [Lentisphaeraceae bacterium]|nr:O-antigen ligase family protein [Lentisphaeraceae bacterium]